MKRQIPNLLTLVNLFCGCLATVSVLYENYEAAFWLFIIAGAFDFGDGLVARALNVSSPVGKELDSLADMVSFGIFPGAIFFQLLDESDLGQDIFPSLGGATQAYESLAMIGFLFTLAACYRLAKFNLDTRQSENFIGLATPAATAGAVGLMCCLDSGQELWVGFAQNSIVLIPTIILLAYLMISEVPFFAFKLKSTGWRGNEIRYIFAAVSILALLLFGKVAFAPLVGLYILLNLGMMLAGRGKS